MQNTDTKKCYVSECEATEDLQDINLNGSLEVAICENHRASLYSCEADVCQSTNNLYQSSVISLTEEGNYYCSNHREDYSFYCSSCENRYDGSSYGSIDSALLCETCWDDETFPCYNCEAQCFNNDAYMCDECEQNFCDSTCLSDHDCGSGGQWSEEEKKKIEEYTTRGEALGLSKIQILSPYRDLKVKYYRGNKTRAKQITIDRYAGVEIEAEEGIVYGLQLDTPKEIGITKDGSLNQKGVEVQTPPAKFDKLEEFINETTKGLVAHNFKGTKSSGLHVHIDARDIRSDQKKILQVIKTFYAIEDMIYSMLPPSRWDGHYCKKLATNYLYDTFNKPPKELEKNWYKVEKRYQLNQKKHHKYDSTRYYGLNVHSIFFRGTIELRYHSGSVNAYKIINWVDFLQHIVDYAINHYDDKQVQKLFDMPTSTDKYYEMEKTFGLNSTLSQYIYDRMGKFNPNFRIQFNKGKALRVKEERENAKIEEKINKYYNDQLKSKELIAEVTRMIKDRYSYDDRFTKGFIKAEILSLLKVYAKERTTAFFADYRGKEHNEQGGFIKSEELTYVQGLIDQGSRLTREGSNELDSDL